jgi:hypothetical protein
LSEAKKASTSAKLAAIILRVWRPRTNLSPSMFAKPSTAPPARLAQRAARRGAG